MNGLDNVGGYRLLEQLGSGGMGSVYLGTDAEGGYVAVKVLHPHIAGDQTSRKRLAREVRTLRKVRHPRIAEVLDAELDSDAPFIVTEFVDGATLSDDVTENGAFAEDELVHFGHGLLDALRSVHEAEVVHRDLKPANVMIMDGEPMVIDFGIAQAADEVKVTATGLVMGTPGYLSPEIAEGMDATEATDWWGWGATMAFAATGSNPYGGGPLEAILGRVAMGKANLEGTPERFVPLLRACLDPKPERRPGGDDILRALVDIESGRVPRLGNRPAPPRDYFPGQDYQGAAAMGAVGGAAAAYQAAPPPQNFPELQGVPRAAHPGRGMQTDYPGARQYQPQDYRPGPGQGAPGTRVYQQVPERAPTPQLYGSSPQGQVARPPAQRTYGALGLDSGDRAPAPQRRQDTGEQAPRPAALPGGWALLTFTLFAIAVTALGPFVVILASFIWMIVARTAAKVSRVQHWKQFEYGPQTSTWSNISAVPGALIGAFFASLACMILPIVAGLATAVLLRVDVAGVVPPGWSENFSLWGAGAAAALVTWFGPGGGAMRLGSRVVVRRIAPPPMGSIIAPALGLVLLILAVSTVMSGAATTWFPLPENPFSLVPTTPQW